jgi:hypothetical protein
MDFPVFPFFQVGAAAAATQVLTLSLGMLQRDLSIWQELKHNCSTLSAVRRAYIELCNLVSVTEILKPVKDELLRHCKHL